MGWVDSFSFFWRGVGNDVNSFCLSKKKQYILNGQIYIYVCIFFPQQPCKFSFWVSMWKLEVANPSLCSAQDHGYPWVL